MTKIILFSVAAIICKSLIGQPGTISYDVDELEHEFKIVKLFNSDGQYAEFLYEGDFDQVDFSMFDDEDISVSGNGRDSYDQTVWLPSWTVGFETTELGVLPSDFISLGTNFLVYGGRKIVVMDGDNHTQIIKTIEVSEKGSLNYGSFTPLTPYVRQLVPIFTGGVACATTGGELVILDNNFDIEKSIEDNEDAEIISSSVAFGQDTSQYLIWTLNYWNDTAKIKKLINQGESGWQQVLERIFEDNEIIDSYFSLNNALFIRMALLDSVADLDPNDFTTLFSYPYSVDKLEGGFGHIKNQKQFLHFGGDGIYSIVNNDSIEIIKAFGSCYDLHNGIVYFTGINENGQFRIINHSFHGYKSYGNIGVIHPVFNILKNSENDYSVACAGKEFFMGFDDTGTKICSEPMNGLHGYRTTVAPLNEGYNGGVVACLTDGIVRQFIRYTCNPSDQGDNMLLGLSCSMVCAEPDDHWAYYFYNGDGINPGFTMQQTNSNYFQNGIFDEMGTVNDCIYHENSGKVVVAFYSEYTQTGKIYLLNDGLLDPSSYTLTENGIPELLFSYDDFIFCAAKDEMGAELLWFDPDNPLYGGMNFPGRHIIAFDINQEQNILYCLSEGENILITVSLSDFNSNIKLFDTDDPKDLSYNPINEKIYVADYTNGEIDIYNAQLQYLTSLEVQGFPEKLQYDRYQNNLYAISSNGNGIQFLTVIDCTTDQQTDYIEMRKSDGLIYDKINDQIYFQTNHPSGSNNNELTLKTFDNWSDGFSNQVSTGNASYSDMYLQQKRLVKARLSIDPESNKVYPGNYGLATASIINAYDEELTIKVDNGIGWKWLSFPRMERYKDETFDAITLLKRFEPWPPQNLYMEYDPLNDPLIYISYVFGTGWNILGGLTEVKSSQGYKLNYQKSGIQNCSIRLEGAKLDYSTIIDLGVGENWVGYFLDKNLYPEQCLPANIWEALVQIKTQYWSMTRINSDPPYWFLQGKKTPFKYGDLVILKTSHPYSGFQWQNQGTGTSETVIPPTTYYSFDEQPDYLPFYVETDSTSDIMEIAVLADGEVKGAAIREAGDTLVEVNGYLQGVPPGAVIEFETWNGYKSEPFEKGNYVVIDHHRKVREKRNIYAGEKAGYYHVSLKNNEVYEMPPEIGFVTCQPNPFGNNTAFTFRINEKCNISIQIFDLHGNPVKMLISGYYPEGYYNLTWNGDNKSGNRILPGVYFYKVSAGNKTLQTDKIVLIK